MKADNQLAISLPVLVCRNMGRYNAKSLSKKLRLSLPVYVGHFCDRNREKGLGLLWLFQGTYVTVGAYMRLEPSSLESSIVYSLRY